MTNQNENMTTTQAEWDKVKIRSRIKRINEMVAFHRQRMIEWPSIDGNAHRMAEIGKLNDEMVELKRMLEDDEKPASLGHPLASELLDALRRLTHPMASDEDLQHAIAVIAKAEGREA
jgi:hypothetical protein